MIRWTVGLLLVLVTATGRADDETPLDFFGSDAAIVVRLAAPEKTTAQIAEFVDAVQPGAGEQVTQQAGLLGVAIANPALTGVDQTKDWYIIVFAEGQEQPTAVFAIPATDTKAMQKALNKRMKSKVQGDWVFYTDKELPGEPEEGEELSENFSEAGYEQFMKGDLGIYVNVAQLTETYQNELEQAEEQAREAIQKLPDQLGPQGEQLRPVLGAYTSLLDKLIEAVGDAEDLTITLNASKAGLVIEELGVFSEDSATVKRLAEHPTSKLALLSKLPPNALGYFGVSANLQKLVEWGGKYNLEMMKDEDQKAAMEKMFEGLKTLKFGGVGGAFDLGDQATGLLKYVAVTEVTPASKLKDQMRAIAKAMPVVETQGIKQETTLKQDAETISGTKVDIITVKQEVEDPNAAKIQAMMFGEEGMVSRIAYTESGYVQTMGGGKAAMEAALKSYKSSPSSVPATNFQSTLLPASNLVWMVDLPTLAIRGAKLAPEFGANLPFEASELDDVGVTPSFMGGAIAIEENALRMKFHLSTEQAQNIAKLVMFGIQKQQGQ